MANFRSASASAPVSERPADTNYELVSYLTLRRVVGVLGVSMPIVVAVWGLVLPEPHRLHDAISDYYGFRTRDVFVGVLFTIAWFLFTYRGYDRRDSIAGNLACIFALGVALFPDKGNGIDPTVARDVRALGFRVLVAREGRDALEGLNIQGELSVDT